MKLFYLISIIFLIISCSTDDDNVTETTQELIFEGDVILNNQTEIEEFGAIGYVEITGKLEVITEFETTDPILDLSSLATLEIIGGDLRLINLTDLPTLNGLNNLTSISGYMYLYSAPLIQSLNIFSNVTSTVTGLEIFVYRGLTSLDGLDNISIASGGDLIIEGNDQLLNLNAIENAIPSILGTVKFDELVFQCAPFISCEDEETIPQPFLSFNFIHNVNEIELLRIKGFAGTELTGFENLTTVSRLSLWRNSNLVSLQALNSVTSDIDLLFISENNQVVSLSGIEGLGAITQGLTISLNDSLGDLCALQDNISPDLPEDRFQIILNAFNPTQQDIADGNCSE